VIYAICARWIDEVRGIRCGLSEGHEGPCRAARVTYSVPDDEREHFITCQACGTIIDCRRLGDVLEHEERCAPVPPSPEPRR
jgi:hypothetical protein